MVFHEKVWIGREVRENSTRLTDGFEVKVGLHQGSTLSPCLFAMVMDRTTDEIREEAP